MLKLIYLVVFISLVSAHGYHRKHSRHVHHLRFLDIIKDQFHQHTNGRFPFDRRHFDKEEMILFPDIAFQSIDRPNQWRVILHGWRYEGSRKKDWLGFSASKWLKRIASQLVNSNDILYLNGSINRDRLRPFFVEDESKEVIEVFLGSKKHILLTDKQGQFYEEILVTDEDIQQLREISEQKNVLIYEAIGDNKDTAKGVIRLIEPMEGISVISDIDDTIKVSEVLDKLRLLANTFIHPFKAVPGNIDLYSILN